eukprot:jgi/Astpho2/593/e_gw1.00013.148.1_t
MLQLEKYQEQAQLLDPHMEGLIRPMAAILREQARSKQSADMNVTLNVCKILWTAASCRGFKIVVKFFPNEAADLEPVLDILLRRSVDDDNNSTWEALCTLTLWLSQLVLIPFDLAIVDSQLTDASGSPHAYPPLVATLLTTYKEQLGAPGSIRNMAALLLGRLLTRPDQGAALRDFVQWAGGVLASSSIQNVFILPGEVSHRVVHALAAIFKTGQRAQLATLAEVVWPHAVQLLDSPAAAASVSVRKFAIKLVQRIGLVLLPPQHAGWRYQAGASSLTANLANAGGCCLYNPDVHVPCLQVIAILFIGLRDKDTVVRWSAAKGIGRITARLPLDFADDVAESVGQMFSPSESDTAWHGACLAAAELAMRGLLLPARLPEFVPLVAQALHYDVRRGPHSVGAHVRDAAAYVCWAFARAYTADVMADTCPLIAPALMTTACYDREVNCRRAASAAFQESVGRQGHMPHGIDILTAADYYTLSTRSQAYLSVAPQVAGFAPYRPALVEHLMHTKLQHWERSLRELSAQALAALVPSEQGYFQGPALEALLPRCLDPTLEVRHGAIVGLAEVMLALDQADLQLSQQHQQALAAVVPSIEKARLYRGKGGELMRAAVCRQGTAHCVTGIGLWGFG